MGWIEYAIAGIILGFLFRITSLLEKIANNTASVSMPVGVKGERGTPHPDDPQPGNQSFAGAVEQRSYCGHTYTMHGDGMVVAAVDGATSTWRDERAFKSWADRNSVAA